MRLKEEQIRHLAEKIYADLEAERLVTSRSGKKGAVEGILAAIRGDMERELTLERDAERILDETVRAMGRAAGDIDRRKMLRMIKEKLAKERRIVL